MNESMKDENRCVILMSYYLTAESSELSYTSALDANLSPVFSHYLPGIEQYTGKLTELKTIENSVFELAKMRLTRLNDVNESSPPNFLLSLITPKLALRRPFTKEREEVVGQLELDGVLFKNTLIFKSKSSINKPRIK
uniref:Uncharacterized protein n=1 Tax=Glossina austeni TaxID=7395 RepID=A0A1A9UJY0_GLOAU